jgi:hypothetical protein
VRDEKVIPLEAAVRRLTSLPAENLKLDRRGLLKPGHYADIVVFDPAKIQDHATYETPHQYSTGVVHVFVNGVQVLRNGVHTGAKPGRVVRGAGWRQGKAPSSKPQVPSSKLQKSSKPQAPDDTAPGARSAFEVWSLGLIWGLGLGSPFFRVQRRNLLA